MSIATRASQHSLTLAFSGNAVHPALTSRSVSRSLSPDHGRLTLIEAGVRAKRNQVEEYVHKERLHRGILRTDRERKAEISGEAQGADGEFVSLLERQLLTTEIGYGAWTELADEKVLEGVWQVIQRRQQL